MKPELLTLCEDARRVELTPVGHEFALSHEYEPACRELATQAEQLTGSPLVQLMCSRLPISDAEFGAEMPPVVSWLGDASANPEPDRFLLHLRPEHSCFAGHFPGQPILAGVIQLHWAVQLAQRMRGCATQPREIKRLKFHRMAVPPSFTELQLHAVSPHSLQFRVQRQDVIHAQGVIDFGGNE